SNGECSGRPMSWCSTSRGGPLPAEARCRAMPATGMVSARQAIEDGVTKLDSISPAGCGEPRPRATRSRASASSCGDGGGLLRCVDLGGVQADGFLARGSDAHALDARAERLQLGVDVLVAAIDLVDAADDGAAVGREGGDDERDAGADV